MSISQQLVPIYNTTVHNNKITVALNLMWLTVGCLSKDQQATRAEESVEGKTHHFIAVFGTADAIEPRRHVPF